MWSSESPTAPDFCDSIAWDRVNSAGTPHAILTSCNGSLTTDVDMAVFVKGGQAGCVTFFHTFGFFWKKS